MTTDQTLAFIRKHYDILGAGGPGLVYATKSYIDGLRVMAAMQGIISHEDDQLIQQETEELYQKVVASHKESE